MFDTRHITGYSSALCVLLELEWGLGMDRPQTESLTCFLIISLHIIFLVVGGK